MACPTCVSSGLCLLTIYPFSHPDGGFDSRQRRWRGPYSLRTFVRVYKYMCHRPLPSPVPHPLPPSIACRLPVATLRPNALSSICLAAQYTSPCDLLSLARSLSRLHVRARHDRNVVAKRLLKHAPSDDRPDLHLQVPAAALHAVLGHLCPVCLEETVVLCIPLMSVCCVHNIDGQTCVRSPLRSSLRTALTSVTIL